ncbi:MAG: DUF4013 domain-containing protein [Methanoregulaceae archaeon]
MDYGRIIDDALAYTKEGVWEKPNRWMKLILAIVILGIPLSGYILRIYRGATPAPEVDRWGSLFIDGLKLYVIALIYSIPVLAIWLLEYGRMLAAAFSGGFSHPGAVFMAGTPPNIGLLILMYVIQIVIGVILPVAAIRFARTGTISEAFRFGEITGYIGKIGWVRYILALIIVTILVSIPIFILMFAFIVAGILIFKSILGTIIAMTVVMLIIMPFISLFQARYMTCVYDSAIPAA